MTTKYTKEGLENKVDDLSEKIELIMTNHLPHLSQDMESLKVRISIFTLINIGGIILGMIASRFFL